MAKGVVVFAKLNIPRVSYETAQIEIIGLFEADPTTFIRKVSNSNQTGLSHHKITRVYKFHPKK